MPFMVRTPLWFLFSTDTHDYDDRLRFLYPIGYLFSFGISLKVALSWASKSPVRTMTLLGTYRLLNTTSATLKLYSHMS
jgi:hypothetical protein